MILVDTSIWADHIAKPDRRLLGWLSEYRVLMHPFVTGELLLGSIRDRHAWALRLNALPQILPARHVAVMEMIERNDLFGTGIGYVDAHLLSACLLGADMQLHTKDKRLAAAAVSLGLDLIDG